MSESRRKRYGPGPRNRSNSGDQFHKNSPGPSKNSKNKMNNGQAKPTVTRQASQDHVRKIVQEEGRTARNLIAYNVPVEEEEPGYRWKQRSRSTSKRSPSRGNKSRSGYPLTASLSFTEPLMVVTSQDPPVVLSTPPVAHLKQLSMDNVTTDTDSRPSSVASGPRKGDLRARYWAFLFDNLQRAVDEIYQTCEADESELECKEVIMMLEQCTKDFKSLISRIHIMKDYENAKEGSKPTSLAWELRKTTSPGKGLTSEHRDRCTPSPTVQKSLNFSGQNTLTINPSHVLLTKLQGNSWADKVKGTLTKPEILQPPPPQLSPRAGEPPHHAHKPSVTKLKLDEVALSEDSEGWETVHSKKQVKNAKNSPTQKVNPKGKFRSPRVQTTQKQSSSGYSQSRTQPNGQNRNKKSSVDNHQRIDRTMSSSSQPDSNTNATKNGNKIDTFKRSHSDSGEVPLSPSPHPSVDKTSQNFAWVVPRSPHTGKTPRSMAQSGVTAIDVSPMHSPGRRSRSSRDSDKENKPDIHIEEFLNDVQQHNAQEELFKRRDEICVEESSDEISEEEEVLATRIETEYENVLDDQSQVEEELEEMQNRALESAIQQEEDLNKAIEKEENEEIIVDTEPESDLGSTLNTTLGSSVTSVNWENMLADYEKRAQSGMSVWSDMVEDEDFEQRTPGRGVHMHEKLSSPSRKRSKNEARRRAEEKQAKAQQLRGKLLMEKSDRMKELYKKVEEIQACKEELLRQRRMSMDRKLARAESKRQLQLQQKVRRAHEEETKANEIAFINTLEAQNKRHEILSKHQDVQARLMDIQEERQRKQEEKAAKEAAVEERRKALEAERQARLHEMQQKRKQRDTVFEQRQMEREKVRQQAKTAKDRDREERIAALNAQHEANIKELQKKIQLKQDESARRHNENLQQIREKAFEMSILRHSSDDHNDAPKLVPYDRKKLCAVCNVLISSEVFLLSHLRGKKHQQALKDNWPKTKEPSKSDIERFNLKNIIDAPQDKPDPQVVLEKERQKALKKRCKKLRQRMTLRGQEFENSVQAKKQTMETENKAKIGKLVKELTRHLSSQGTGPWPQNRVSALDRALGEIKRVMEKKVPGDQIAVKIAGGLTTLTRILMLSMTTSPASPAVIPTKSLVNTSDVMRHVCASCYDNCHYMLFSNKLATVIDILVSQLNILIPESFSSDLLGNSGNSSGGGDIQRLPSNPLATSLLNLLATVLLCLSKHISGGHATEVGASKHIISSSGHAADVGASGDAFISRSTDIISYIISNGIVDKLTQYFSNVRGPVDGDVQGANFLLHSLNLLTAITRVSAVRRNNIFEKSRIEDTSQLISTLRVTELVGIVSLMYGMLLHSGAPARGDNTPPELPTPTLNVTISGIKMLNHIAALDLCMLQEALGEEGTSLQFRHIASYLIWYCCQRECEDLLHEVIVCVGHFSALCNDNQLFIQSGQPPTVLQQLCSLPFQYFSDRRLTNVLFPSLIACCYDNEPNTLILQQELSCSLLANFLEGKILESQQEKLLPVTTLKQREKWQIESERMDLSARFPIHLWTDAYNYFHQSGTP
ncbi:unnamed protein product [Owenia fusiformis]|uniref:U1-type domain-containing protein n=1 Tax=Owenia fusiformis TaxID=6347 RepID=A0A8S4PZ42_OWEFU|nr:unnamed protein product [Owenia fusiformis]